MTELCTPLTCPLFATCLRQYVTDYGISSRSTIDVEHEHAIPYVLPEELRRAVLSITNNIIDNQSLNESLKKEKNRLLKPNSLKYYNENDVEVREH